MIVPPQAEYLYRDQWTSRIDDILVSTAIKMKTDEPWSGTSVPSRVVFKAGSLIEKKLRVQLTPLELTQRLLVLEQRYLTFNQVITWPGACWIASMHTVIALEHVWKEIFKAYPFAAAYYHQDGPEFYRLGVIFGRNVARELRVDETIVISDSETEELTPARRGATNAQPVIVDSPLAHPLRTVRRQLFADDDDSLDRESTNAFPPSSAGGRLFRKPCDPLHSRPKWERNKTKSSPVGSSCASCSPLGPARSPFP